MFENIINSLLGEWGAPVLSFVYKYQLIISIVVVAFGIVMIVRRRNKNKKITENNDKDV